MGAGHTTTNLTLGTTFGGQANLMKQCHSLINSEEREILFSESSVLEDKGFYKMILTPLFVAIWYYTYGIDYHAYIDLELPNNLAYKQPLQASDNFNLILRLKFPIN